MESNIQFNFSLRNYYMPGTTFICLSFMVDSVINIKFLLNFLRMHLWLDDS